MAKTRARQEIGVGKDDFLTRPADRPQIGALDGAAVAQVVAQDEARPHPAHGRHLEAPLAVAAARVPKLRPRHQIPQPAHGGVNLRHQRPLDRDGIVVLRRQTRRGGIVDDVDAADETDTGIHQGQLAVQAAQAVAAQAPARGFRAVDQHPHPRFGQRPDQRRGQRGGAEAVDHEVDLDAAPCRTHQCRGDAAAGLVVAVDVGFQVDVLARPVAGGFQRREIFGAVFQQGDAVAGEVALHSGSRVAVSAAWSESLCHTGPACTLQSRTLRPRT